MINLPAIIVNCKTYAKATGEETNSLALVCESIAKKQKTTIALAVQSADINHVDSVVQIPILAQHIDPVEPGAHTGATLAEDVKKAGAVGTLINHSEKRLKFEDLEKAVEIAKKVSLFTIVCAATPDEAVAIAKLKPDMIAIEPPELIGGDISVSKAEPEIITAATDAIKDIPILCGAGIKTKEDVKKAKELGVKGILVSSGVVLAENPEKILNDFCEAFI